MKRTIIALLSGLAVFGGALAMAATLGGLTSGKVGADNTTVASCDSDGVTTSYSAAAWDSTDKRYEVGSVTVSGVSDTCDGSTMKVSLTDSSDAQLSEGTLSIPSSVATSFTVSLTSAVSASATSGVHVVIGS